MKRRITLIIMMVIICLFASNYVWADEFGILSETYVYPDGLRLDTDSKLQIWNLSNLTLSDDTNDKREGEKSLKGFIPSKNWFGFGIIWDPDQDNFGNPKDMSAYANGSLKFWVKTQTPLKVGIQDAINFMKWVNINVPSDNQWRFVSIPFSAFGTVDFSQVFQLFAVAQSSIPTATNLTFHFDNVRWSTQVSGPLDYITVYPSPWTIPGGLPKSFIAKGFDANNNTVDIYPTWSHTAASLNGTFIRDEGPICIFKPTSGSGGIIATDSGITGRANVQVQDIIWNDFFNILIDEGLYGSLGAYDADDGNADGDGVENNSISLDTVTNEHPVGYEKSLKATYSITSIGWAGYFIQEGELANLTSTRDVSNFQNGYLHFWVKTPVDLEIGLRSGNISAGDERSKLMLSEYNIPADNIWHEVYIALDDFKIRDNRLDFTQSKVLFNAAVVGERVSNYSGVFLLSDIKYVRRKEAVPSISVNIKRRSDNAVEPSGQIKWPTTTPLGSGWKIANQYLEVAYNTTDPSWGGQIYTDNLGNSASPRYSGDPTKFLDQQPGGLIGEGEPFLTCPMAWIALDDINQNIPVPVEITSGDPKTPNFKIFFKSDTNGMWGTETARSEWSWLKDRSTTRWNEDTDNDGIPDPAEIVSDFSQTGDEYSTFLNPAGIATGWFDVNTNTRLHILNPESPIVLYLAAKFEKAKVLQKYKTNTLTLELYHY